MKKIILSVGILIFITVTLLFRVIGLEKSPLSVGFDEASLGYNAYSLLKTGNDEYGNPHPLSLRSFNDFKPALYAYLAIPFINTFDLNATSVRLPSAVMGTVSLIFFMLIFKKISKSTLLTSLLVSLAISFLPWRIHFSRVAFEANISMAFFTGVVWCLINFNKNTWYKIGAILFSVLSIYSYHSSRIAIPILLILALLNPLSINLKRIIKEPLKSAKILWPLLVVLILYIPLFLEYRSTLLLTRFTQTNLFSHYYPFTPRELITAKNVWLNFAANPVYYLGGLVSGHIFAYLSPKNLSLLIYPGVIKSAQAISGLGMLGFAGGIFFISGLIFVIKNFGREKYINIIFYWILAGIIPAIVTWEWYYPLRSLNIYPALDLIVGFGILIFIRTISRIKITVFRYSLLIFLLLFTGLTSFYVLANEYNYGAWDTNGEFQPGGFKESANLLNSLKNKYKTVYVDSSQGQSYELLWFYLKYPPQKVQKLASSRNKPGVEGPPDLNFDNFIYKKFNWPKDRYLNNFVYFTNSEVKEDEIKNTPGAKLTKIVGPYGNWVASVITKE